MSTFLLLNLAGCAQSHLQKNTEDQKVGGPCEGCEAIYESPIPFEQLSWLDTLPDFEATGPKMVISGVVYDSDGKPAPGVVLYVYHTDQNGKYSRKGGEKGWGLRHGYIRGWMKTNEKGEYRFYTLRPASYPHSSNPQHIHPVVKEKDKSEYYIDEFLFDDDLFLTKEVRAKQEGRGGNGIVHLEKKDGILYGKRDIYLGRNIPGYPSPKASK